MAAPAHSLPEYAGPGRVLAPVRLVPSGLALASFAVGLTYTIKVNVVGEAALAELLLPLLGLVALTQRGAQGVLTHRAFLTLCGALLLTLAGYIASDLVADSSAEQFLRGWGRVALVMTSFIALALLAGAQRQTLWWFLAGWGVGRVLFLRLVMNEPLPRWKFASDYSFGYAEPMTLLVIALCCRLSPRIASLLLVGVGLYSIRHDSRIQAAVCIALAAVLWMRSRPGAERAKPVGTARLAVVGGIAMLVLWTGLQLTADDYTAQRRGTSEIGRSVGKVFALKAISESPLLGYGSWSRNREFLRQQQEALEEVAGEDAGAFRAGDSSSSVHSMLLQAWVEGGLLGAAFFVVLMGMTLRRLPWLVFGRPPDPLYPFLLYFAFYGLWHGAMSPFAAPLRLHLALAAVVVVCLAMERSRRRGPAAVAQQPALANGAR